ncbi:MAG TPA: BatA and WFA domain-containing protein [Ktedonobacteraceae bacterium]|nr:BatA and WFA domain-containing protein [Ktedonobacteraceae bacterium]
MSLLLPGALAFSIIIPVIFLFYFMRPKRQERVVSSILLWQQASQDLQASRPWQKLRITALLLLQILAAIVIVLVLARPATFISSPIGGNTIIILQTSASMQATDVPPSRFEAARSDITNLIDGLGPTDQLSLITMAKTPQVLIAFSSDKSQLASALQQAKVTNQNADLEQALSLATSLAAGRTDTQILVIGDGHVLQPDQTLVSSFPVRYLQIGTDAPNAALLALASQTIQGKLVALAQIANYSHQQRSIPVELYADGNLVGVQTAILTAGASGALQWGPLPPATRFLHARIISQDAMTIDHQAWAIAGGSMHGRVLLVTKGNSFIEAALRLQPNIDLFETTPDKYKNGGNFDLTVFDGYIPSSLPFGALFFVNPPTDSNVFGKSGAEISISHISAGNDSPNLLNQVDLSSIHVVRKSHQLTPAPWMQPIIVTPETPLLIAGEQNNRRIGALSFDLHDSDLPLQPTFPILIYNLVNWFLPLPVAGNAQVAPDSSITIQAWPGAKHLTITGPDQHTVTVAPPFPVTAFNNTDKIGIYSVTQITQNQELHGAFAVNLFDPLQSRLTPSASLPIAQSLPFDLKSPAIPHVLREIWPWIAAFLLLVLCAEWWLFSRSYTIRGVSGLKRPNPLHQSRPANRRSQHSIIATLQNQAETQFSIVRKRINRVRKRLKNKQQSRGRSNVKL